MPTQFVEERLPASIYEGSKGGPGFSTDLFESETGFEQRNRKWAKSRARYDIGFGIRSKADMDTVIEFFYNMGGRATGFRYKDWLDYQLVDGEIGPGDGAQVLYQIFKEYTSGGEDYVRNLTKIVSGTVEVEVNATPVVSPTDYTIDLDTGLITFAVAPPNGHTVVVNCEFDVPVRFDIDQLTVTAETWLQESVEAIPLVEIKPVA